MRRKRIIIGVLFLIAAIIVCAFVLNYYNGRNNKDTIVLSTYGGTIYDWECKMVDKDIATIDNVYKKNMEPAVEGGEIQVRYTIKGIKKGKTKFVCNYKSKNDDYSVDTSIYEIIVDEKLNVKIINNN